MLVLAVSLGWPWAPTARAADGAPLTEGISLEAHGFVSQGAIKSTGNNYLVNSKRGSLDFTEMGLNFTTRPTDRLRIGFQLFARRLGTTGNFNAKTDWFYFDYRWRDWLGIRAGRVKLPFGLYNDVNDIDAARVPILLPQSVYPISSRDFLLAQSGLELYGYRTLRTAGALDYRLYAGAAQVDLPNQAGQPFQITSVETPYIVGGRLLWETPLEGLRVGGTVQALRLDLGTSFPAMPPATMSGAVPVALKAVLWVASAEYNANDVLLAAEYGRWHVHTQTGPVVGEVNSMVLAGFNSTVDSERLYGLAAYRVKAWLQPGVYYSLYFPNVDARSGRAGKQHDTAATLRFDINHHWLVKLEGHYMNGTAGLSAPMNGNTPLRDLPENWFVFLLKTTAYF
jgi:hypothetical protein